MAPASPPAPHQQHPVLGSLSPLGCLHALCFPSLSCLFQVQAEFPPAKQKMVFWTQLASDIPLNPVPNTDVGCTPCSLFLPSPKEKQVACYQTQTLLKASFHPKGGTDEPTQVRE